MRMSCSLFFYFLAFLISCKSVPTENIKMQDVIIVDEKKSSLLYLPQKETTTVYSIKDTSILHDIQISSPSSLRRAIGKLHQTKNQSFYRENLLAYIAYKIYIISYPTERRVNEIKKPPFSHPYIDIFDSIQQGLYEFDNNSKDFFSLVLPSLVVFSPLQTTNYYTEAEKSLEQALEIENNSVLVHYLLALIYQKQQKIQLAQTYFQKAFSLDSESYDIGIEYAQSILTANPAKSYEIALKFIEKKNYSQKLFALCADATIRLKNWQEASTYISFILESEPNNIKFLLLQIQIFLENKEFLKASSLLDSFESSGLGKTQEKMLLLLRSRLQFEWSKNIPLALEILEQALTLYPDDIDILLAIANISVQTNQTISSIVPEEIAQRILDKEHNNLSALLIFIETMKKAKNWKKVLEYTNKYLEQTEMNSVLIDKAWALYWLGEKQNALAILSALHTKESTDEIIQQSFIKMQIFLGKTKDATAKINELLPLSTPPMKSMLYYYSSLLAKNEELKLSNLRLSLTSNPRNIDALFSSYTLYFQKADYRKAQYYLRQVVALVPYDNEYKKLEQELKNKIQ
ncbi:MAG: tetratricopeptide repeat protein [Treponemataceae bacterium]